MTRSKLDVKMSQPQPSAKAPPRSRKNIRSRVAAERPNMAPSNPHNGPDHRWPFGKIDGSGKWNKPPLNQALYFLSKPTKKGHQNSPKTALKQPESRPPFGSSSETHLQYLWSSAEGLAAADSCHVCVRFSFWFRF